MTEQEEFCARQFSPPPPGCQPGIVQPPPNVEVHTVPLPATPILLILGLAVLCAVARRK